MYLKSEKELYRARRRSWRLPLVALIMFLVLGGGSYTFYLIRQDAPDDLESQMDISTPTPFPTPTPSLASSVANAEAAYAQGKLAEAIAAYQHALNLEPNQADLYLELSHLLIFDGVPERGAQMAREALRRQPENARAWALLCLAYDWLGMPADAIQACETALDLDPELAVAHAYLAEAYMDAGNWFNANAAINTALQLDDQSIDVLRNYGYVMEVQGNYTGAIEAYRQALEINPFLAHLHMAIGRNAQVLGNYTLTINSYKQAVEVAPDNTAALDRLGWTYLLQGDYKEAQENLERAIEIDPKYYLAQGHLATLYFQNRNYEDAIEAFKPAIRYYETASRRKSVFFVVTLEDVGNINDTPLGEEFARGVFVHPVDLESPLRAQVNGSQNDVADISGWVRLNVVNGRYVVQMSGIPQPPADKVYVGWFLPLYTPEGLLLRIDPIIPSVTGDVSLDGTTGAVKGPPIEQYYTLALCYYFLDQCEDAQSYIEVALRIDPNDANALQTQRLCWE